MKKLRLTVKPEIAFGQLRWYLRETRGVFWMHHARKESHYAESLGFIAHPYPGSQRLTHEQELEYWKNSTSSNAAMLLIEHGPFPHQYEVEVLDFAPPVVKTHILFISDRVRESHFIPITEMTTFHSNKDVYSFITYEGEKLKFHRDDIYNIYFEEA